VVSPRAWPRGPPADGGLGHDDTETETLTTTPTTTAATEDGDAVGALKAVLRRRLRARTARGEEAEAAPPEPSPEWRTYCYACRRAQAVCLCDAVQPYSRCGAAGKFANQFFRVPCAHKW